MEVYTVIVDGEPNYLTRDEVLRHFPDQAPVIFFEGGQKAALKSIDDKHAQFLRETTGSATIEERDTWVLKILARILPLILGKLNLDKNTDSELIALVSALEEMLAIEAGGADGVPELMAEIAQRFTAYTKLIGVSGGVRSRAREAVRTATNGAELGAAIAQSEKDEAAALAFISNG